MTSESLFDDTFVGGVAYEVIQHAELPVMKAKTAHGRCDRVCEEVLTHVVHPTDFSDNAEILFSY